MRFERFFYTLKKMALYLSLTLLVLQFSCVAQQTGSNFSEDSYSEDLTILRPKFEPEEQSATEDTASTGGDVNIVAATQTVNAKVDTVLDSLDRLNQLRKFVDGFTIQIYSGQNREEAISAKSKMVTEANDLEAYLKYMQPKFQVTVGQYYSKLEAQKDLLRLRRLFSNAILIPEKILIK